MNQLQVFNFGQAPVRTVEKDGQPWFVLNDIVQVLGLSNSRMVKERLSDDVSSTYPISDTLGRMQQATIINEDGLYDVILESRKPEAKAFRKWVTREVLPSIRKHGGYLTPEKVEEALLNPDVMIQLATNLKEERARREKLQQQIELDKPKVIFAEALEVSRDSILIADLAKILRQNNIDIGEIRLFKLLREQGYLIKSGSEYNMPTQRSMDLKIMEIKVGYRGSASEGTKVTRTTKITGKGINYFINKFKGESQLA